MFIWILNMLCTYTYKRIRIFFKYVHIYICINTDLTCYTDNDGDQRGK